MSSEMDVVYMDDDSNESSGSNNSISIKKNKSFPESLYHFTEPFNQNINPSESSRSIDIGVMLNSHYKINSENNTLIAVESHFIHPGRVSPSPTRPDMLKMPLVISLVGLPAHGKSYLAKQLKGYLEWIGINTMVCNVGKYRRNMAGRQLANFFDTNNKEALALRMECVKEALADSLNFFLHKNGGVVILDATNSTRERRQLISDFCEVNNMDSIFIELICDNEDVVINNIKNVKLNTEDYDGMEPEAALKDFQLRLANYRSAYQTLCPEHDRNSSYIKFINMGERLQINHVKGTIHSKIVYFLMNLNIKTQRTIYLTRHGESKDNIEGKIGGNSSLSESGIGYSQKLFKFIEQEETTNLEVFTSQLTRTKETANPFKQKYTVVSWTALNELDAGIADGLTYAEFEQKYPKDFQVRYQNKLTYRYPMGESYQDVVMRLEPLIMELERKENDVLMICHQGVMRCIYTYLMNIPLSEMPHINCELHSVIKLVPGAYSNTMTIHHL